MNGNEFYEVRLTVEKGRIVDVSCKNEEMLDTLLSYVDTDAGSRYFGEVAIGTNYGIQRHAKNILFDEKIGGSMHMRLAKLSGGRRQKRICYPLGHDQ